MTTKTLYMYFKFNKRVENPQYIYLTLQIREIDFHMLLALIDSVNFTDILYITGSSDILGACGLWEYCVHVKEIICNLPNM